MVPELFRVWFGFLGNPFFQFLFGFFGELFHLVGEFPVLSIFFARLGFHVSLPASVFLFNFPDYIAVECCSLVAFSFSRWCDDLARHIFILCLFEGVHEVILLVVDVFGVWGLVQSFLHICPHIVIVPFIIIVFLEGFLLLRNFHIDICLNDRVIAISEGLVSSTLFMSSSELVKM